MQELDDLVYFAAVVEHGGFSAAARALGAPKSKVSRRVASLEARLDLRLLERSSRRVAVTAIGREVHRHAAAALAEAQAIEEVALRSRAEPRGLVRVSCPIGTERMMEASLPRFLAAHPLVQVHMLLSNRRIDLIEERVDVAIRVRERLEGEADFRVRVLGRSRAVPVAAPALLAREGTPRAPADLLHLPWLERSNRSGATRWTFEGAEGERVDVESTPRFATGDFPLLVGAAEAGLGVALVPEHLVAARLADGRLADALPGWSSPIGLVHLVYPSSRGLLPAVRAFIDFAAEALAGSWDVQEGPHGWQDGPSGG